MTTGTVARGRTYVRRFDWDEAGRRRAAGESASALAREYGVSVTAVVFATDAHQLAKQKERAAAWQQAQKCVECGEHAYKRSRDREPRCRRCACLASATTVRPDELRCTTCREWKPDEAFSRVRTMVARRLRHRQCRECNTASKREWRRRKASA